MSFCNVCNCLHGAAQLFSSWFADVCCKTSFVLSSCTQSHPPRWYSLRKQRVITASYIYIYIYLSESLTSTFILIFRPRTTNAQNCWWLYNDYAPLDAISGSCRNIRCHLQWRWLWNKAEILKFHNSYACISSYTLEWHSPE